MTGPASVDQQSWARIARRYWREVIDAWHAAERPADARTCAELAVATGLWPCPRQRPVELVSGLTDQPLHDPELLSLTGRLRAGATAVAAELATLATQMPPVAVAGSVRSSLGDDRHRIVLCREGRWVGPSAPVTRAALGATVTPGGITVLVLPPCGRIGPRCGPTNALLQLLLPVALPTGIRLRVADETVPWREGQCLLIDDSFEHEIRHDGPGGRPAVVLVADVPHPGLGAEQAEALFGPAARLQAVLREVGLDEVGSGPDGVVLRPGRELGELAGNYLAAAGIRGVRLDGDRPRWQYAADR